MFDGNILSIETIGMTSGPWDNLGGGVILKATTKETIGTFKNEADAIAVVAMRNNIEELLETIEELEEEIHEMYTEEEFVELEAKCGEFEEENFDLKDKLKKYMKKQIDS